MKYPIGTTYTKNNMRRDVCTVIDYHTTTNLAGEVVCQRYVTVHSFLGQAVTDIGIMEISINRGDPVLPKGTTPCAKN